jgi:hypothetical protein
MENDSLEQLRLRTRIFPDRSIDKAWDTILSDLYNSRPELDSARNLFIRINNGLGDVVCTLGLMRSWKQFHKAKNVFAIANASAAEVLSFYPGVLDHVIEVTDEPRCSEYHSGNVFGVLHRPTKPYVFGGMLEPWFTHLRIPYLDRYRIALRLPPWAQFQPPAIHPSSPQVNSEIKKSLSDSVVIAPFARTIPGPTKSVWTDIVAKLKGAGISVYTNMQNSVATGAPLCSLGDLNYDEPIAGSLPLRCNLSTLLAAAPTMRGLITTNSGLAWLLAESVERMLVLHSNYSLAPVQVGRHGFTASRILDIDQISKSLPWVAGIKDVAVTPGISSFATNYFTGSTNYK